MSVLNEPANPMTAMDHRQGRGFEHRRTSREAHHGRARRRQLHRQRRKHWLNGAIQLFATIWLGLGMLFPVLAYGHTGSWTAGFQPVSRYRPERVKAGGMRISAGISVGTSTPGPATPTATPTITPTAAPTATPLPPRLVQATAWQATLDQAAGNSHATQTQAAGQYAATQTALPAKLTANALDRAATSIAATPTP